MTFKVKIHIISYHTYKVSIRSDFKQKICSKRNKEELTFLIRLREVVVNSINIYHSDEVEEEEDYFNKDEMRPRRPSMNQYQSFF